MVYLRRCTNGRVEFARGSFHLAQKQTPLSFTSLRAVCRPRGYTYQVHLNRALLISVVMRARGIALRRDGIVLLHLWAPTYPPMLSFPPCLQPCI